MATDPHNNIVYEGAPLQQAQKVLIMLHGRGADAHNILALSEYLTLQNTALIAPEATGQSWYPFGFLAPMPDNALGVKAGVELLEQLVTQCVDQGIDARHIYLLGFSQGACLVLQYLLQHPSPLGGIFALSGALMGPQGTRYEPSGLLSSTPLFLGCSDNDPHVPTWRLEETAHVFEAMEAKVHIRLYKNMPHTIIEDELKIINNTLNGIINE